MTNEVGIGSSMHDFFADFWIKAQTSPLVKGWNDPGLCSKPNEMLPCVSFTCISIASRNFIDLCHKKLSNFICEFVFIHMIKEWQLILCCKFLCCPKELSLILAVFCHESHVKLAYCFIHYRSRFIFSLPESIQILNMSRFDLTLCIPLALWLISLLFLEVIGELFPISEWKSKHMLSGLWAFHRVC